MIVHADQIRAARAYLNWKQTHLADRADVNRDTIVRLEKGKTEANRDTLEKIVRTFELAGIEFTKDGIRKKEALTVLEGDNVNFQILDDIYFRLKGQGGEVLIAGLSEVQPTDSARYNFLRHHIKRLMEAGISERILVEEGETNFVAPLSWYRTVPSDQFQNTPFQIYADRIVMKEWGDPERMVLIQNARFANTMRTMFDLIWNQAKPVA